MNELTMTRMHLTERAETRGILRKEATFLINSFFKILSKELQMGTDLSISSFGTFRVRKKNKRIGRNPKTGVSAVISERRVVTFKASQRLKESVNKITDSPSNHTQKKSAPHLFDSIGINVTRG